MATPTPPSPAPATPTNSFPPVQPGGSLLIAWQVRHKPVMVVGGGNVAAGRILSLLAADAHVHLVSPPSGLTPEVLHRINTCPDTLTYHPTLFTPSLLDTINPTLVLTAIDDPVASTEIYTLCHSRNIPINVADVPPECDFYFGSVHRNGPLQVMVSTNGNGPKLANLIRMRIARTLPENVGEAVGKVGGLRRRLRKISGGPEEGPRRMEWMSRVCENWSLEELCQIGEAEVEGLLRGYKEGRVPSLRELKREAGEEEEEEILEGPDENGVFWEALDGAFGWM